MKVLIFMALIFICSSALSNEFLVKRFFIDLPYEELHLHEMLELKKTDHVMLIQALKNNKPEQSPVSYKIENDTLRINLNHGGSFEFYILKKNKAGHLGVYNSYWRQISSSDIFDISKEGLITRNNTLLQISTLYENDLLLPEDRFPDEDNDRLIISPSGKGLFVAHTNGWYIKKWENRKATYGITFRWDGEMFKKHIKYINND